MKTLNQDKIHPLYGNDKNLFRIGVNYFLELTPHLIFNLERCSQKVDSSELLLYAHSLANAAGLFGGDRVEHLCHDLIQKAEQGKKEEIHHLIKTLDYECTKLLEELRFYKDHSQSA